MKTFLDLCHRYGISKSTFSEWIHKNRKKIDPKGTLIQKSGRTLLFTEAAIDKIDQMRGYDTEISLFSEIARDEEMESLKNEINNLKTQMLVLQERTIKAQEQALAATVALNAATVAQIESAAEKARHEAENHILKEEIERLRRESAERDQPPMTDSEPESNAVGKWRRWRNRHLKW